MRDEHHHINREDVNSLAERHGIPARIAKAILRIHGPSAAQCDAAAIAYRKRVKGHASRLKSAPENERQSFHHSPPRPSL